MCLLIVAHTIQRREMNGCCPGFKQQQTTNSSGRCFVLNCRLDHCFKWRKDYTDLLLSHQCVVIVSKCDYSCKFEQFTLRCANVWEPSVTDYPINRGVGQVLFIVASASACRHLIITQIEPLSSCSSLEDKDCGSASWKTQKPGLRGLRQKTWFVICGKS